VNPVDGLRARISLASLFIYLSISGLLASVGLVPLALSLALGSILSVANFWLLGRELAASIRPGRFPAVRMLVGYVVRMLGLGFALALLYLRYQLPLIGLAVGALAVQAVILGAGMAAALEETITGQNSGRFRGFLGLEAPRPGSERRT